MKKTTIVYLPRRSRIRLYKIAKAVKLTRQFKLVLICEADYFDTILFEDIFDEVLFYNNNAIVKSKYYKHAHKKFTFSIGLSKMISLVKSVQPDLIHAFCEPYDHIVKVLKETNIPIVMSDGADFSGISSGIENLDKKTKKQEKFCFENVQGIIHKGPKYEVDYYKEHGYSIKAKELIWFDHPDEDLFCKGETNEINDIHIVYVGHVSDSISKRYIYYVDLAKSFAQQKLHFHIYPNPYQYKNSSVYINLSKENDYFHWHNPLPYKELSQELSKYHWGLWWHEPTKERRVVESKQKTAIGNKLFSYLEAGLPVIVGKHNGPGRDLIKKLNLGYGDMTVDDIKQFRKVIEQFDYKELKKSVYEHRKKLSLQNSADKLAQFYNILLTQKGF